MTRREVYRYLALANRRNAIDCRKVAAGLVQELAGPLPPVDRAREIRRTARRMVAADDAIALEQIRRARRPEIRP